MDKQRITTALNASIAWLAAHRAVNIALVIAYSLFILLAHDIFVQLSVTVMVALTLPVYNIVVASIALAVGAALVGILALFLREQMPDRNAKVGYLFAILLMLVLHHLFLFEMNVEVIHAMQFAVLAFLLFPLSQRFGVAIIMGIPIMLLDEWFQYRVLYPAHVQYFDFNDILMDILGCALLMCSLWAVGADERPSARPIFLRPEAILLASILALGLIASATCLVVPFPENACPGTWLVLNTLPDPLLFWREHPFTLRVYHAMPPLEGTVVLTLVAMFFMGMGGRMRLVSGVPVV